MATVEIISQAIKSKKPISFVLRKSDGRLSNRIANPYAIYIYQSKTDGSQSTKVDVVQTAGETDTPEKPFPSFRGFLDINDLLEVKILEDQPCFGSPYHKDYNPDSERYKNPIIKI